MRTLDIIRGLETTETITFVMEECCNCSIPFMLPYYLQKRLIANKGERFYCPNGHPQSYTGPTEVQKLQQELDRLKREKEQNESHLNNRLLSEMNEVIKVKKQLKRVQNGVCPCCNRSFSNLHQHMKTKHPETPIPIVKNKIGKPLKM